MPKRFKSDAFEAVHETMAALRRIGAIDDARMRHFDELCLEDESRPTASPIFAVYKDVAGRWRWRLTDQTGRTLAISPEGFDTRSACLDVIGTLRHLEDAVIEDAATEG